MTRIAPSETRTQVDAERSVLQLRLPYPNETAGIISIQALDFALAQRYADMIGLPQLAHLLDVQVVDDQDVKNRAGYGAMFSSLYNRPIQIWER